MWIARVITLTAVSLSVSCGDDPPVPPGNQDLFPIAVGNYWTFELVNGEPYQSKTQTVIDTATTSDGSGFRLQSVRKGISPTTDRSTTSVQGPNEGRLMRYSEQTEKDGVIVERVRFSPAALRVDLNKITLDATYSYEFVEEQLNPDGTVGITVSKDQVFVVEAVDETITVPAGTFQCVRLRRDTRSGSTKTYYYAPGVGKVKEVGGQVENLSSYHIN